MPSLISSTDNAKIKNLIKLLEKSRERKRQGVAVVEGKREIAAALKAGFRVVEFFYCEEYKNSLEGISLDRDLLNFVTEEIFKNISCRENPDGFLAVVSVKEKTLSDLVLSANPLVVVMEGAEKPGNLGAVVRTAEAVGADAIILNGPLIDVYNPNVVRSSQGAIFGRPIIVADREETIVWLKKNKIKSFATSKKAVKVFYDFDYSGPTAFVLGSEHSGLTAEWKEAADEFVTIPMSGKVDSLNLSVSASIMLFEAIRQRRGKI